MCDVCFQDSDYHLWVGADNEGLFELGIDGKRIRHYQPDGSSSSVASTVMCMYEDSNGDFGLDRIHVAWPEWIGKQGSVTICRRSVIKGVVDSRRWTENLYIATLGSGFYRYNLQTKELKHYESSKDEAGDLNRNELANDWVNYLFCDKDGIVWLAHYKGISCFNPQTGSFLNYRQSNTLITDCVGYALLEDSNGYIWAGTTGGLFRFNKKTEEIEKFTVKDGLSNDVICGLCEDGQHNIWISTYNGISKFDVVEKRFINYYAGDGIQGNEFTHGAFYRAPSGKIFFGGVNGITAFLPDAISSESKTAEVCITDFFIFNQPVRKIPNRVVDRLFRGVFRMRNAFSWLMMTIRLVLSFPLCNIIVRNR